MRCQLKCHHGTRTLWGTIFLLFWAVLASSIARAEDAKPAGPDPELFQKTVQDGIRYLETHQAEDGSFSSQMGIGPTALAVWSLLRNGRTPNDPAVAKGLAYLEKYVQKSGAIQSAKSRIPNYETCVAIACFQEANRDGRYDKMLKGAEAFVRGGQWTEADGKDKSDLYYGGAGYGGPTRPDLSNTAFLIDALKSCGAGADDEAIQKAMVFVSRCQNLETEHNTTPFAAKINDGGFYYTCVLGRMGQSREKPDGGLRSYGAMTYSGLKSMIYAGLGPDDPRVKAALAWIRKHYDLSSNPGMGDAGLYYYYHTFAKALDVLGVDLFEDADGAEHDWRRELTRVLAERQQEDGSWVNTNRRWMETDPNLVTSFSLLALSYCRPE